MQEEIVAARRYLHEHAEVGFELPQTLAYLKAELEKIGCAPIPCGKAGLLATIGKGKRCILLRADIDGLPIREETGLPFASKTGCMHACGHDMHAAMLLGAAKLLKAREKELNGTVKLLFQPAEELLEGAKDVIEGGVLENPRPQAAMMLHVMTAVELPVGSVVVAEGTSAPAADFFTVRVQGKGCHGSTPWNGVDALSVGARILLAFEEITAKEISISTPAVLTVGSLETTEGGNVISDFARLHGTLRSFDEGARAQVKERMEEIATHVAKAFRATAKITYGGGCPTLVNDDEMVRIAYVSACEALGEEKVFTSSTLGGGERARSGGSEDFAYISHEIPSVMLAIAAGGTKTGQRYPLHHPKATFNEEALYAGSCVYAHIAIEWLRR